jgi:Flp pilus assembly pilin Flp
MFRAAETIGRYLFIESEQRVAAIAYELLASVIAIAIVVAATLCWREPERRFQRYRDYARLSAAAA